MQTEPRAQAGRFIDPTVPILLAALAVHVVRRNFVDVAVFGGAVLVIAVDHRWPLPSRRGLRTPVRRWVVTIACVAFGLLGLLPVGSVVLRVALVAAGVLVAGAVLTTAHPNSDAAVRPGRWWAWPVVLVALALLELTNFLQQPDPQTGSYRHPTISTLIDPLLTEQIVRFGALALWLAAGWWLARAIRSTGMPNE